MPSFMPLANRIPARISEALRQFPPFSMFSPHLVDELSRLARVKVLVKNDPVWRQGDPPGNEVLFLAQGRVEYHREVDGVDELVDVRDVGDILGLSALHEAESFRVTALVTEDAILYVFPWPTVLAMLEQNDQARNYVRRHLFWGTRVGRAIVSTDFDTGNARSILEAHLDGAQVIQPRPIEHLLSCLPEDTIRSAAVKMVQRGLPSVLVIDPSGCPLGFLTNDDLVKKVVVGRVNASDPVSSIMDDRLVIVAPQTSSMAALLTMLNEQVDHICITTDGTAHSQALDVCAPKDLLAQSGHHPVGIANAIQRVDRNARFRELCDDIEQVSRSYLEAGVSGIVMGQICAQLYENLIVRMTELAIKDLETENQTIPSVPWAWLAVGSDGRREQVLRTDMDNAFVFKSSGDPEIDQQNQTAFLTLTERVVAMLVDAGFSRCQGGVMASNPRWCKTDTSWLKEICNLNRFDEKDGMLRALILYDLRYVAGDRSLCRDLRERSFQFASHPDNYIALMRLAERVVAIPPPLNFRGKFVVEKKGLNEGEFDIKTRGLAPLRDAARVLVLKYGLRSHHSTGGRWQEIGATRPDLLEVAQLAWDGYDLLLRLRNLTGLQRADDGHFIDPSTLNKLERQQLANVFDVQRMVQDTVRREFDLEVSR